MGRTLATGNNVAGHTLALAGEANRTWLLCRRLSDYTANRDDRVSVGFQF